jgi:acetoacetyl-[acyl-carrier protein] synthase
MSHLITIRFRALFKMSIKDTAKLHPSIHHPRGLQIAVYGASDAIRSTGIERETLSAHVQADEIAVYDGAALGRTYQNPQT